MGILVICLFLIIVMFIEPICLYNVQSLCRTIETIDHTVGLKDKYNPIVCEANFSVEYKGTVNMDTELIYVFPKYESTLQPPRIKVQSANAKLPQPLLIVVTQLESILSWQIPLDATESFGEFTYSEISRTLCPAENSTDTVISVSTRGKENIDFTLMAVKMENFTIEVSEKRNLKVSPSEPQFFKFVFDEDVTSALLHVTSDSDACMTLSVQNNSCPVYDMETTIQYRGLFQTVLKKGGIFLRKDEFPFGMFIVFVVHSTDEKCTGKISTTVDRTKAITFELERNIGYWDYVIAVSAVLVAFFLIYITTFCLVLYSNRQLPNTMYSVEAPVMDAASLPPYGLGSSCATTPTTPVFSGGGQSDDSDLDETDVDMMYDADSSKEIKRTKQILFLSDLAQKDPRVLSLKSSFYLWNLLTVAVFYALPVVQLVFTYQQVSVSSGNQDLCYYNFLCSHRLAYLSDFNHVFSNIGYFLFGMLYLCLTYRRHRLCHSVGRHLGIPYHYGMFYALGVALCMEGVLSACYHLCPNHSNFQFDTSFMYVLSMLSMIKIYQTRHPDITASAYTTFGVLAFVIFLGMFGVLNGSDWFYVVFTVAHLFTCFVITAQIYHVGTWKFDGGMVSRFINAFKNDYIAGGIRYSCRPLYPTRMVLLFLANLGNWGLVAVGYYLKLGDFATYMLSIFLANLFMYFIFYIVMKVVMKETILRAPLTYIVLSFVFWGAGFYFFYHKSISWKLTPSESRAYNQPCEILNFYDKHDIWHFLSAGGLFFSFMTLLTLDDDIAEKDRRVIPVF